MVGHANNNMQDNMYKITGWLLMAIGVIYAAIQISLFYGDFADFNFVFFTTLLILALTIPPGMRFIYIGFNKSAQNRLSQVSLAMIIISSLGFIYSAGFTLIACVWGVRLPLGLSCAGFLGGVGELFFGVYPSVALYVIGLIFMLISRIYTREKTSRK